MAVSIADSLVKLPIVGAAFEAGDLQRAQRLVGENIAELLATKPHAGLQTSQKYITLFVAYHYQGRIEYLLGDYAGAEKSERASIESRRHSTTEAVLDKRDLGELSTWLAMAVARQGRLAEAAELIAPVVKFQRELAGKNHGDQWLNLELAAALYAQALTDKVHAAALLHEAAAKIDALPAALRAMHDIRLWRDLIGAAERGA